MIDYDTGILFLWTCLLVVWFIQCFTNHANFGLSVLSNLAWLLVSPLLFFTTYSPLVWLAIPVHVIGMKYTVLGTDPPANIVFAGLCWLWIIMFGFLAAYLHYSTKL